MAIFYMFTYKNHIAQDSSMGAAMHLPTTAFLHLLMLIKLKPLQTQKHMGRI